MVSLLRWLVDDWKLKLLALTISVALLFSVAFSQLPTQTLTVNARLNYTNSPPSGLIVDNPPSTTRITITGLASNVRAAVVTASADLSKLKGEGTAILLTPTSNVLGSAVTVTSVAPITLKVEPLASAQLAVTVLANAAQGWQITNSKATCGNALQVCHITVTGPTSLLQGLSPYVVVDALINGTSLEQLGSNVRFRDRNNDIDLTTLVTIPAIAWSPQTVTVNVGAKHGLETIDVALLDALPLSPPAAGYRVTRVTVTPQLVTVTGSPDAMANIQSITLAAVRLAGYTSNHSFTLKIVAPDPTLRLSVQSAVVTYFIAPDPAVSPTS